LHRAISTYTPSDFQAEGYPATLYNQLKYVTHDEERHVQYLTAGLTAAGAKPVAACTYAFGYSSVKSFLQMASVVEGLGVAAYLGAAPSITNKAYLSAAGAILVTEAIHQGTLRNAIGEIPMAMPYGTTSMSPNAIYSIASMFIKSCPRSNVALPFMAYPALKLAQGLPTATGTPFNFQTSAVVTANATITFVGGLSVYPMPATVQKTSLYTMLTATIPSDADFTGQVYAFVTRDASGNLSDANIVAGPAILEVTPNAPTFDLSVQ